MSQNRAKRKLTYSSSSDSWARKNLILGVEFLTGRRKLERMYQEVLDTNPTSEEIWRLIFEKLQLSYNFLEGSPDVISTKHPSIVIANHPFGVIDGVALGYLISQRRSKFKFLVNEVLCREELLEPYLLPIDFKETKEAVATNLQTREKALECLEKGETIIIFPSGGVATSPSFFKPAEDLTWKRFVAKLIRRSKATVIPIHFEGSNSWLFQLASQISMDLRLGLLLHEVNNKIGKEISVSIRKEIPFSEIQTLDKKEDLLVFLRKRVFESVSH